MGWSGYKYLESHKIKMITTIYKPRLAKIFNSKKY